MNLDNLPSTWTTVPFSEALKPVSISNNKVKAGDYEAHGTLPLIDQGQEFIGGFTNDESRQVDTDLPVIIFGDHTRVFKYVNFRFGVGADGVKVLKPTDIFNPKLLYYFLQCLLLPDKGYARHFQYLRQQVLPRPPTEEQEKIVDHIETQFTRLDAAVAALKRVQANLRRYRASVLKAACEGSLVPTEAALAQAEGRTYEPASALLQRVLAERRARWQADHPGKTYKEPVGPDTSDLPELPEGWCWATVEQVAERIVDCLHSTPAFVDEGTYFCVDTNCIEPGRIIFERARLVSQASFQERIRRLKPAVGDILFAREGTVGTTVVVPPNVEVCLGQRMMMFRLAPPLPPTYTAWAMSSPTFERQWQAKITGTTVPHVNIADVRLLALPIPPLAEQNRIAAELEQATSLLVNLELNADASRQRAVRLRQSILQRAFSGELTGETPASAARV